MPRSIFHHPSPAQCIRALLSCLALSVVVTGCSTIKHTAVDTLGDALAAGGTTFSADDDPQLIAAAVPFSLKLMESLLAERPDALGR